MKLHEGALKLAGLYLAIMMAISLFFSLVIYEQSIRDLDRGLRGPVQAYLFDELTPSGLRVSRNQLQTEFETRYQEAKDHVLGRLVITNLFILMGGGALAYYLALRTLRPIEEAHEAQNRFTADASHELRTPIAAMRTENEVTLMNPHLTLAQARTQLKSNIEELEKLTALSEGLLKLASFDQAELSQQKVSLDDVVEQAISNVQAEADTKNIDIEKNIGPELTIAGDRSSLAEVFTILLDNAIKYSAAKTTVQVRGSQDSYDIAAEVIDQGIGIKTSDMAQIFDRFYRADNARSKQNAGGYGLGLAIASNIIELHHGTISVASQPGKGSTFKVSLPAAD